MAFELDEDFRTVEYASPDKMNKNVEDVRKHLENIEFISVTVKQTQDGFLMFSRNIKMYLVPNLDTKVEVHSCQNYREIFAKETQIIQGPYYFTKGSRSADKGIIG
ncbi:hypothetical protein NPIL_297991 [Nephila pilipes]|uniref:Uncharacterized protein n=1 Tax=Nephila pilipes TaxID=299642 RepID=A0A8X6J8C0_NEPPI|nr:hypothetical protein NPIL_297981 [Nephila pilipes]GFS45487.1 hypothetical protein NPIL_297991 [Nephila pilipes]